LRNTPAIIFGAGVVLILFGTVMAAVWFDPGGLAARAHGLFLMKMNTALAFSACGAGLIAAFQRRKRITLGLAVFVFAFAAVIFAQYPTGLDFHIDQLLSPDVQDHATRYPGRMAPNTALAFMAASIVLALKVRQSERAVATAAIEIFTFLVFGLGAAGLIGHLAGVSAAHNWFHLVSIAPQTAAGLMVLGAGLMALSAAANKAHIPFWLPALLCFVALAVDMLTPRGMASALVYVPLVLCSRWYTRPSTPFVFAAIATLLGILAVFAKQPAAIAPMVVLVNRALTLSAVWFTATLIFFNARAAHALRQSQIRLEAVVDNAVDGLIAVSGNGEIETFNPASERIFGYSAGEVLGKKIVLLIPELVDRMREGRMIRGRSNLEIIDTSGEITAFRKDGTAFPIDLSLSPYTLEDGPHYVAMIRDVTSRKRDAEEREASANRLKAVVDTVLDGLITIDRTGTIQTFNAAAERIFGHRAADVIGQNVKMLMPDPYHSEHDGYIANYLRTGERKVIGIGREVTGRRKDGSTFPMELGINDFSIGGERAFVGTVRDISERKKAEASVMSYTHALERSNKDLDDFAYIASHDLKEPLRGLFNNARFLQEDYEDKLDQAGVARLKRLGYLCQRMEQLINDLLYFSRLGRHELAIQPLDLSVMIRDIELTLETTLTENNAKISTSHRLPTIVCDKTRMTEAFRNLITNAVKYNNSPQKMIEIGFIERGRTKSGKEAQILFVRDNGMGIAEEFHDEIFRIFKRLNPEEDGKKGTGVGLTFVRKIIERHGGEIWLDSKIGEGTTFYFTIKQGVDYGAAAA
jgi:PAS domain S-box-containing protein